MIIVAASGALTNISFQVTNATRADTVNQIMEVSRLVTPTLQT